MKDNLTREALRDFNYKNYILYDNEVLGREYFNLAADIKVIKSLAKKIIKTEGVIFSIKEDKNDMKYIDCKNRELFLALIRSINSNAINEITTRFPIHTFNPYVDLVVRTITNEDCVVQQICQSLNKNPPYYNNEVVMSVDKLNQFINSIRQEAGSQQFKKAVEDYKREPNDNYNSLMGYINELFKLHPRLLVLRIDLHHKKDADNRYLTEIERNEKYWQIKGDLAHLFMNMRSKPSIFKHMFGYAWKLEHTPETGFHYHTFFFFNEKKVHHDVILAKKIGDYWANKITIGRGRYYSCNGNKHSYKLLGIGKIKRNDAKLRQGLEKAVAYVTKVEGYNARLIAMEENGLNFARSDMPKARKRRQRQTGVA